MKDVDGHITVGPILNNDEDYFDLSSVDFASQSYIDTQINNSWPESHVTIDERGVTLEEDADITVNGRSLTEFMDTMSERLLILQPDFEKMEQYPALKKAYEQYKLIERLLQDGNSEDS